MRVIRDQFAHIDVDGQRVHTKVRILQDDAGRVAVFLNPNAGPQHIYNVDDVTLTRTGGNCSHPVCHGKANRAKLTKLWEQQEAANV